MFKKLAYSQRVLRALAVSDGEKQAGLVVPLVLGAGLMAGAHGVKKGIKKSREYEAGFAPGVAETRVE